MTIQDIHHALREMFDHFEAITKDDITSLTVKFIVAFRFLLLLLVSSKNQKKKHWSWLIHVGTCFNEYIYHK